MPADLTTSDQPAPEAERKPISYAEQRLVAAGITAELNGLELSDPLSIESHRRTLWHLLGPDADDNLEILYPTLGGSLYTYENGTKNNPQSLFKRVRLKEPKVWADEKGEEQVQKYTHPGGARQQPFFTPGLVRKFAAKEKISVLFAVEGELKAMAGYARGLDIMGLPGNQMLMQDKGKQVLHEGIAWLLEVCQVETFVLLHDADALVVKWERDKDLAKRPQTFSAAVINFRESLQPLIDDEKFALKRACYMHGNRELCPRNLKGLDDLLIGLPEEQDAILSDLRKLEGAEKYFNGKNITTPNYEAIKAYFGVSYKPKEQQTDFYALYKADIGPREFVFRRKRYQHNGEGVVFVAHEDTAKYCRVGADWYKFIYQENAAGELEETLEGWKVGEIQRDYKRHPEFLDDVPKYDGFTNVPNFNGKYQKVVHGCLNLVTPLNHVPAAGDISRSMYFLKHLFGGQGTPENNITADTFTVALDWLTLLLTHPKQKLPVPVLVSPENNTGKSTFLNWLCWIFGANATVLNNEQFKMKFNAHYITKYIIGLDESFQDLDKKSEKERLKQLVTADTVLIERKGVDLKKVPFYGKVVMCSNDADRVMKIDEGESRWFVVRVPVIKPEDRDPDLGVKLQAEIPALLHFLHNRPVHHERKDRLWFKAEWFITEQFKKIVEATKNRLDRQIEEFVKDMFLTFRCNALYLSLKWLAKEINSTSKYRIDELELKNYFQERRGLKPTEPRRIKIPLAMNIDLVTNGKPDITEYHTEIARAYVLDVEQWLSPAELGEFNKNVEPTSVTSGVVATDDPGF